MDGVQARRQVGDVRTLWQVICAWGVTRGSNPGEGAGGATDRMAEGRVRRALGKGQAGSNGLSQSAHRHQGGTLAGAVGGVEGTIPFQAKLVKDIAVIEPGGMDILVKECVIGWGAGDVIKVSEVAEEDALE